ncbi:MAG: Alanine dehydrogenase [Candidatus Heimdallarchaeota archaeon LC_3]|nr:MAG: Alanine dehydrogenase [Candidatus Heimdallarchaeota archaeon LC_3]
MVLILTRDNINQLLTMKDTLQYVEEAYKQLALGNAKVPQRIHITDPAPGLTLIMPGIIGGGMNALATKIVSVYKDNLKKYNLPTVLAKIIVQDMETGEVVGIMDGNLITAMRTGAATGVSVKYLARKESKTLGIYGAGVQAKKQVSAVYWALDQKLQKCKVYDINKRATDLFKTELENEMNIEIEIVNEGDVLLKDSDILTCATISANPLFDGDKIPEGTHLSSIGAHSPTTREFDSRIIERASTIVAGLKEACLTEAGDFIIPINEGIIKEDDIISIGDIIVGKKSGRENEREITLFKSVGISAQDVAVAKLVYDRAVEKGIGINIDF